jgi:indole-3-glycerol phosphate synthase
MVAHMPEGVIPVSESGISRAEEVRDLAEHGYRLFLMGEAFMKTGDPGSACRQFMKGL